MDGVGEVGRAEIGERGGWVGFDVQIEMQSFESVDR